MGININIKVQLALDKKHLVAVLTHFQKALTVNLEPCGIDNQMYHWHLARRLEMISTVLVRLLMRL